MSNAEAEIHAALMARVETLPDFTLLWPQKGGDQPSGEHVRVAHLPNDNEYRFLGDADAIAKGYLVLTLVSDLGQYEAVTKRKAGEIAAHFPYLTRLTSGATTLQLSGTSVRGGRQQDGRWETPVMVGYWAVA